MKKCMFVMLGLLLLVAVPASQAKVAEVVAVLDISGDWMAESDLSWQAMAISMQGHANRDMGNIYLLYPRDYKHPGTHTVLEYYQNERDIKIKTYDSADDLVRDYTQNLKKCVVWDRNVLTTLRLAFTVAGLEDALIVSDRQLPLAKELGLEIVADFRDQFTGKTDAEIYEWAIAEYWERCSRDYLLYLGEWCRVGPDNKPGMKPGIGDFGIIQGAFFTDLSTSPADPDEYVLADKLHREMNDYAYMFGWHSYCKDQEAESVTMISQNAMVVAEGLATMPNMSFHRQVPLSKGFKFKQKATYNPNPKVEDKVYIALVQSDGLGIGSWTKPGRGKIPYAWETNMEWIDFAPALLQYYYEEATENDFFIGSLSGPGYLYPKAYPPDKLPGVLQIADDLMARLDLHVFGIMDFSQSNHMVGNVDLPKSVVDAYYENMPHVKGFFNGYDPANTYDCRDGRPFISYNYYVDARLNVDEVVRDFRELARMNPQRPYFLPVHVRENNDVDRMKKTIKKLGDEFEIVNPVEFVIMAGKEPTMTTRFVDFHPDFSGTWVLDRGKSRNVFVPGYNLDLQQQGDLITLSSLAFRKRFVHHRELRNTRTLQIGGPAVTVPEDRPRRMGYLAAWSKEVTWQADWAEDGKTLLLKAIYEVETNQGTTVLSSVSHVRMSKDWMTLTISEYRDGRQGNEPATVFVFQRAL